MKRKVKVWILDDDTEKWEGPIQGTMFKTDPDEEEMFLELENGISSTFFRKYEDPDEGIWNLASTGTLTIRLEYV